MTEYSDYHFKFSSANLSKALSALSALRSANIIDGGNLPANMLGDPRDSSGNITTSDPAFYGKKGLQSFSYVENGEPVFVPSIGDPNYFYIAIRTTTTPDKIPFNPLDYGLEPCTDEESAEVLGVWA